MANDPHLFLTLPGTFYEAHMVSDELKVYGYTIPGIPLILSGHNYKVTWGITNGEWDLTDRYKLKVKDDLYFYDGQWIPFKKKEYEINVRGFGKKKITQQSTVHGKVFTDIGGDYYAQKWYAADKSYSVKSLYLLMKTHNWKSFKKALSDYDYPPQNFVYSDIDNNIGVVCAGKLPNRVLNFKGGILDGTKELNHVKANNTSRSTYNPENLFLFSANQQPIQNEEYFGAHWHKNDYRINRIHSLLKNNNDWDINKIGEMQLDKVDLSFFEFEKLLNKYDLPIQFKDIFVQLDDWDGNMISQSNSALVYEVIRKSMKIESIKFARTYLKVNKAPSFKYFLKYLNQREFNIPNSISKQRLFENILRNTDSILKYDFGKDWMNCRYAMNTNFSIPDISFLPEFKTKVEGLGGNKNTINMNTNFHPAFRLILEIKENSINGYSIMAGGQSGKLNSPNYKNQLELWRLGKYNRI